MRRRPNEGPLGDAPPIVPREPGHCSTCGRLLACREGESTGWQQVYLPCSYCETMDTGRWDRVPIDPSAYVMGFDPAKPGGERMGFVLRAPTEWLAGNDKYYCRCVPISSLPRVRYALRPSRVTRLHARLRTRRRALGWAAALCFAISFGLGWVLLSWWGWVAR